MGQGSGQGSGQGGQGRGVGGHLFNVCTSFTDDVLVELFEDRNRNRIAVFHLKMREAQ